MLKEKYHVLALGGIGMSAVARLLMQKGHRVSGYDKALNNFTNKLEKEGVEIAKTFPESTEYLIYSSAISPDHAEIIKAKKQKIKLLHRSHILSQLMQDKTAVLISGTHGKTTVSGLLAYALVFAKLDPSFAVGGILNNYQTNAKLGSGKLFVSEADESDGSFLNFSCEHAIVTNLDNDHLDYWKTEANLRAAFQEFITKPKKHLIWCYDDENLRSLKPKGISYGLSQEAAVRVYNYQTVVNGSVFSVKYLDKSYENIFIPLFGTHQVLNAAAVIAFFLVCQLDMQNLFEGFKTFKGLKRRQELIGSHNYVDIYHDYAHHPTEICAILDSFRKQVEEKRLVVIFQPHRFSRINKLIGEFEKCFQLADLLYVTDIYNVGEIPIEDCSEKLFKSIKHPNKKLLSYENFSKILMKKIAMHDCILFLGAGDINQKALDFFDEYKKTKQKLKVGIIYGGEAHEHEISLKSAQFFFDNIDKSCYDVEPFFIQRDFKIDLNLLAKMSSCDVCLPVLHGKKGEGGLIQAVLEALKIPFSGCDHFSSSICMNKAWTKAVCESSKIYTAKYLHLTQREWKYDKYTIINKIKKTFEGPLYIKGCHMGSTIGITKCQNLALIENDINYVFSFDDELIVEEEVIGREIEFALWGNDFIHVAEPCEILSEGIYSYEKKYENDLAKIPTNLEPELLDKGKKIASKAYMACGCRGLARIDFFLDRQNRFVFNEINPIPGLTKTSPYYPMLRYLKITENEFINRLIILALHAHRTYDNSKIKY